MRHDTRPELEPAWLLHARPFRDSSLLLEIFTLEAGRVALVAKGVRGPKSRLRGLLQPLQPLLLSWRIKGELGTLVAAEASAPPVLLHGDPLFCAWYVHELLLRLLPRLLPLPELFAAYGLLLEGLSGPQWELALRRFELTLLTQLGHEPHWPSPPLASHYTLGLDGNFVPAETGAPGAVCAATLTALRAHLPASASLDTDQMREARGLLQQALRPLLGPKPLQSRELLRAIRASGRSLQ
jgi:DNA repair protein RecO (recombination protein O)